MEVSNVARKRNICIIAYKNQRAEYGPGRSFRRSYGQSRPKLTRFCWTQGNFSQSCLQIMLEAFFFTSSTEAQLISPEAMHNNSRKASNSSKGLSNSLHLHWMPLSAIIWCPNIWWCINKAMWTWFRTRVSKNLLKSTLKSIIKAHIST